MRRAAPLFRVVSAPRWAGLPSVAAPARSSLASLQAAPCRGFASAGSLEPEAKPDYYKILGVERGAPLDAIKTAFRAKAKQYHPDVLQAQAGTATPEALAHGMEVFKLINEAYTVLSDETMRKEYDADRLTRREVLRRRNEGAWVDANGMTREEAFRASMNRATERNKEGLRSRATMARLNRMKIDVPTQRETLMKLKWPLAVIGLWLFNYYAYLK